MKIFERKIKRVGLWKAETLIQGEAREGSAAIAEGLMESENSKKPGGASASPGTQGEKEEFS